MHDCHCWVWRPRRNSSLVRSLLHSFSIQPTFGSPSWGLSLGRNPHEAPSNARVLSEVVDEQDGSPLFGLVASSKQEFHVVPMLDPGEGNMQLLVSEVAPAYGRVGHGCDCLVKRGALALVWTVTAREGCRGNTDLTWTLDGPKPSPG